MKGINKLDNIINIFLAQFNTKAEMGTDFAYYYTEKEITYSLVVPDDSTRYLMEYFNELAPDIQCDTFLLSLLHEVGHHMTDEELDVFDQTYCDDVKAEITERLYGNGVTDEEIRELHRNYFSLPDEHEATMWAINFMRNNATEVAVFWAKCQAAIMEFYNLNQVEVI